MADTPASDTAEMVPSISEAKDTIEEEPRNETVEKVNETAATPDEATATSTESAKKKKKKKKDPSGASLSEPQNADGSDDNENETAKNSNGESKHSSAEGNSEKGKNVVQNDPSAGPVVSASKRTRPPYKYDPEKVTLRFLFANRDGLTVTVECKPDDTVGEVKGQLLSVWPEDLQTCSGGDQLRLICMGKGVLMPDTRTLKDCEVPVFKTHPTPVNVAVRPKAKVAEHSKSGKDGGSRGGGSSGGSGNMGTEQTGQGCGCVIS
mmetsp:Transcript_15811/g.43727  ORF Transcript_15811/g.43727 Transcript_15811/m.43727 type:complete len:264 (+) Transcript_15811:396-1187(+)